MKRMMGTFVTLLLTMLLISTANAWTVFNQDASADSVYLRVEAGQDNAYLDVQCFTDAPDGIRIYVVTPNEAVVSTGFTYQLGMGILSSDIGELASDGLALVFSAGLTYRLLNDTPFEDSFTVFLNGGTPSYSFDTSGWEDARAYLADCIH